jgi:hypothetical protein
MAVEPTSRDPHMARLKIEGFKGDALAQGVRIVKGLGLDNQYGFKIGPSLAAAA